MPRLSKIGAAALAAFGWTGGASVSADFLVIAGGGAGGNQDGGGGGAGGYRTSVGTSGGGGSAESKLSLNPSLSYTVTIGAGGTTNASATGGNGSNSSFSTITSTGGGGGGYPTPATGGSGGGGRYAFNGAAGTANQGYAGGNGGAASGVFAAGGGGGASAVGATGGATGGNGGAGVASSISGSSVTRAGGGGGGTFGGTNGTGGSGGGGNAGSAGTANTGGGGGGGFGNTDNGGNGGSGVVIISYVGAQQFGGGVVTSSGGNTIHTFTTSGTLSPLSSLTASYLIVAGGGGGGGLGGGGAGGLLSGSGVTIDTNSVYVVTVGSGGVGSGATRGTNGGNSAFSIVSTSAVGGGGGGASGAPRDGLAGGSGGGGGSNLAGFGVGGAGTSGQGNTGGTAFTNGTLAGVAGGGGGGASAVGVTATAGVGGAGGAGTASSISGSSVTYAGGGGGGTYSGTPGNGGSGGGGKGANASAYTAAVSGTANTGGGGGGSDANADPAGDGGSGIVIISYPGSTQQMAGGTVTVAGGNVIHTFTSSGYLTPIVLVTNSLRFRSSASAQLTRTVPGVNTTQLTFSCWFKSSVNSTDNVLYSTQNNSSNYLYIGLNSSNALDVQIGATANRRITTQVFRDPAAWYHLVVVFDTTQATASNRIQIYVNGSQVTAFSTNTTGMAQNANLPSISSTLTNYIGGYNGSAGFYFDGYMTEINMVYGQALTPNSFGTFNGLGVWQPIRYGGSYGTNGFYLPFTNTTSTTTLGFDFSPNGNNWTTNNISLTAGTTYDSMTDVPTLTSATTANYAVWNPLYVIPSNTATAFTNANLTFAPTQAEGTGTASAVSSMPLPTTGKWYWEITPSVVSTLSSTRSQIGIMARAQISFVPALNSDCFVYVPSGQKATGNVYTAYGNTYAANDVIGVAVDLDNGAIYFAKNGTWQNSGVPTSGASKTGAAFTTLTGASEYFPAVGFWGTFNANFGQRPFAYTPPTGFVALNTFNLPTPTVGATASTTANKYFNIVTYTGASTGVSVDVGFNPDFTWMKNRSNAYDNWLYDTNRTYSNQLISNSASAAGGSALTRITNGFLTDPSTGSQGLNGQTYVAWNWYANGGTTVTNTQGSITSTVQANTTAGFSIVTYTGNNTPGATVGHGLGVAPQVIFTKQRNGADSWNCYHVSIGNGAAIFLNQTATPTTASSFWNNTTPSSTVITFGNAGTNQNNNVAYCWAPVAGYSAFGSYTGNGSTDGTFVFTGFRPEFVLVKATSTGENWAITDAARSPFNAANAFLRPDESSAETTGAMIMDLNSNGFKMRTSDTKSNGSGVTYIYMAFAENPFKYANAR
jgi:hypothetical protein